VFEQSNYHFKIESAKGFIRALNEEVEERKQICRDRGERKWAANGGRRRQKDAVSSVDYDAQSQDGSGGPGGLPNEEASARVLGRARLSIPARHVKMAGLGVSGVSCHRLLRCKTGKACFANDHPSRWIALCCL